MRKFNNMLNSFKIYFGVVATILCLLSLIFHIFMNGIRHISFEFLFGLNMPEGQSLVPMIITTIIVVFLTLLISTPIGICSAIYLNEYANPKSKYVTAIRLAIETLSGIPSIVYGLFGFIFYVVILGWSWSIMSGVFTLSIMVLPTIIRSSEEALKTVPNSYREGSYALGAGKFETIVKVILPSAITGILSAVILSVGRIVGETAALTLTAGTLISMPTGLFSSASTLSVFMFTITTESADMDKAYATAIVLIVTVLFLNICANYIASKLKRG